ncbi:MAG: CBS domain-containing protein [Alphaproteobacteria bacterium]|jgi:CBS domain-containing protein|nr:CBS domain-containing protein [Alphaproteobacteria bacterium]MDP6564214.1 CBS domain-containing protein [Alphaproteobacteria bacterium]MDP6815721.1 CBS domain-containing protein [Alphaproteobacteria bacterium]|tara:strand:- start:322 stop:741 length:420 start_codon:yes stop_codon:yes gene_type:complete
MVRKLIPDIVSEGDIFALAGDATVRDAARGMAERDVNSVLITEDGKLLGIFTGTDLVKKVVAANLDPDRTVLREVMTPDPQTVSPDTNAIEALHRLQDGRFRHLPIVEDGKLLGVLSRRDFLGHEIDELEHQDDLWEKI